MSTQREVRLLAQVVEQLHDLRLHGDVERGGRLVGDQHLGVVGDRHRDHHPLAHAAGQLVRVGVDAAIGLRDGHLLEQLDRLACAALLGELGLVRLHDQRHLLPDGAAPG